MRRELEHTCNYADSVLALWRQYDRCDDSRKGKELSRVTLQAIVADCTEALESPITPVDPAWFSAERARALKLLIDGKDKEVSRP